MDKVNIYLFHISQIRQNYSYILSFVDENRKEKASKYINEKDQLLSLGAGYLLKKYLPEGEIKTAESGKLYLPNGPFFNISHSGEYVVLAIHPTRDIGVDIERIDEKKIDGIRFVLNKEEKKVEDIETLFCIWSIKESLIKCISSYLGEAKNINAFPLEGVRFIDKEEYFVKSMIYEKYSLALTLKGSDSFDIKIYQVNISENNN